MTKIELELVTLKEIEPGSKTGFTDLFLMLFKEKDGERLLPVFIGGHGPLYSASNSPGAARNAAHIRHYGGSDA